MANTKNVEDKLERKKIKRTAESCPGRKSWVRFEKRD